MPRPCHWPQNIVSALYRSLRSSEEVKINISLQAGGSIRVVLGAGENEVNGYLVYKYLESINDFLAHLGNRNTVFMTKLCCLRTWRQGRRTNIPNRAIFRDAWIIIDTYPSIAMTIDVFIISTLELVYFLLSFLHLWSSCSVICFSFTRLYTCYLPNDSQSLKASRHINRQYKEWLGFHPDARKNVFPCVLWWVTVCSFIGHISLSVQWTRPPPLLPLPQHST